MSCFGGFRLSLFDGVYALDLTSFATRTASIAVTACTSCLDFAATVAGCLGSPHRHFSRLAIGWPQFKDRKSWYCLTRQGLLLERRHCRSLGNISLPSDWRQLICAGFTSTSRFLILLTITLKVEMVSSCQKLLGTHDSNIAHA
jgi:hypothetical protein